MKVVINSCYGGYGLSLKACEYLGLDEKEKELARKFGCSSAYCDDRTNAKLVECVEKLGEEANGQFANLKVVEIPDGVKYDISDYDGIETIEECHRSWF